MWLRPRQQAPNNIYEGLVTRNVTEPTYSVDQVGYSLAYYAPARMVPSGRAGISANMPDTPIATPPPVRAMRQWNADGTWSAVMTVPKPYRNG